MKEVDRIPIIPRAKAYVYFSLSWLGHLIYLEIFDKSIIK